jgi:hypothetical protein
VSTDDYFQVSITAIDEAKVLIWHRDKLKLSIINDDFLQVVFDNILGRDVVKKLMQVSQVRTFSEMESSAMLTTAFPLDVGQRDHGAKQRLHHSERHRWKL